MNSIDEVTAHDKVDSIDSLSELELQIKAFMCLKGGHTPEYERTLAALERKGVIPNLGSTEVVHA